jgi:hypothetical protein
MLDCAAVAQPGQEPRDRRDADVAPAVGLAPLLQERREPVVDVVGVGHEADLLEELVDGLVPLGRADQLGQVLEPILALLRVLTRKRRSVA